MQKICQRYLFSILILHAHPRYASHIYKILKEYIESLRLISLLYISNGQEMAMLKNDVNLSKITFSVL